jgi:hypothetical protein
MTHSSYLLFRLPVPTSRKPRITQWSPTSSPGREVALVPEPVEFVRPLAQYAVRTPSKEQDSGYSHAVIFTSRTDLSMRQVVDHDDGQAGIEADLKGDKHGLGLATIRKHRLPANDGRAADAASSQCLLWARQWLSEAAPHLHAYGIIRLIGQVWAIPGRLKLAEHRVQRIRLRPEHPRTRDVCSGFRPLLLQHHLERLVR